LPPQTEEYSIKITIGIGILLPKTLPQTNVCSEWRIRGYWRDAPAGATPRGGLRIFHHDAKPFFSRLLLPIIPRGE
jgi:hypothetical protein